MFSEDHLKETIDSQKHEIFKQKKEITESIRYASYIQKALFPSPDLLKRIIPESFIFYRPKDIVSGDFFWVSKKRNEIILAVADCTGHGVPGAFMSILGITILSEVVNTACYSSAGSLLNQMRERVMKALNQTGEDFEQKDGIDMALCIINAENGKMEFSGAFNPAYVVKKDEFIELPCDKMPIGVAAEEEKSFSTHRIQLQPQDTVYLFSDGFVDQFGGQEGKKFKYKSFRNLFKGIHELSMEDQKNKLSIRLIHGKWIIHNWMTYLFWDFVFLFISNCFSSFFFLFFAKVSHDMKLKAFRIKNYRSIKDSGWQFLAYDNITALIGQNESGKTSVLEALRSFYEGIIHDDVLRSDMTFPIVSCTFELGNKNIFDFINRENISDGLTGILKEKNEVTLTREWKSNRLSALMITDDEVIDYYKNIDKRKEEIEQEVNQNIQETLQRAEIIFREIQVTEKEKYEASRITNEWFQKLELAKKKFAKAKRDDEKNAASRDMEICQETFNLKEQELSRIAQDYEEKKAQIQSISEKVNIAKKYNETLEAIKIAEENLGKTDALLQDAQHLYEICTNDREKRTAIQKVDFYRNEFTRAQEKL
ncbi:MAG: SpoIIE family protein phosphatase [Bacteroidales bacterium]|nr:SpoIIE family protein phosphatase [Bacteroidales bacterium]